MEIVHVDAFTDSPFSGNPAAVVLLDANKSTQWMQNIASELMLPETAFVKKEQETFSIRWFTPVQEEELCGHATLASSHVIWEEGLADKGQELCFSSKSGVLKAKQVDKWIELNFPAEPAEELPTVDPTFIKAFGERPLLVARNRLDYLLLFPDDTISKLKPDFSLLKKIKSRGFIATCLSTNSDFDFISRFFSPSDNIPEDPVTGSAHCCLAPFWAPRLGKNSFHAYQASRRGGELKVHLSDSRVYLQGKAVSVFKGEILI